MASIIGKIGSVLKLDAIPYSGAGTPSPISTIAEYNGILFIKIGALDTDWTQASGGTSSALRTVNTNSTLLVTDGTVLLDSSGGAFNLTLCDPSLVPGQVFRLVDSAGSLSLNNVTLVRFSGESIEGLAANKLLQTNWGFWQLVSNGTNWFIG